MISQGELIDDEKLRYTFNKNANATCSNNEQKLHRAMIRIDSAGSCKVEFDWDRIYIFCGKGKSANHEKSRFIQPQFLDARPLQ